MADEDEALVQMATRIQISMCVHGTLTIALIDADGVPFAAASLDPATAEIAADQIRDHLADFNKGAGGSACVH